MQPRIHDRTDRYTDAHGVARATHEAMHRQAQIDAQRRRAQERHERDLEAARKGGRLIYESERWTP
jgi:hypothetical protein